MLHFEKSKQHAIHYITIIINQRANLALFHSLLSTYLWIVPTWTQILQDFLSEILTIMVLSILSKKPSFIDLIVFSSTFYIVNLRKLHGNTFFVHFFEKSKNVFNVD